MQRVLAWCGALAFIVICLIIAAIFAFRLTAVPYLEQHMFITASTATATPRDFGVAYKPIRLTSGPNALVAWEVDAGARSPAILIFHGNGSTVHEWAHVQAYLFHRGVSSMVFDYSGFGKSHGSPTVDALNRDAKAAWTAFAKWAGPQRPRFVVAHSLGTAVALHNAPSFEPRPLGIVTYGTINSIRDILAWFHELPQPLVPLVPDVWDSVAAVRQLRVPLLIIAGSRDVTTPPDMGRQVARAARKGADAQFRLVRGLDHNAIHGDQMACVWRPVLHFIEQRLSDVHSSSLVDPGPAQAAGCGASTMKIEH